MTNARSADDIAALDAQLLDAAQGLEGVVRENVEEADRLATQPAAGILGAILPRSLGGHELPLATCTRITEAVARQDPAAGWTAMIGLANQSFSGWLGAEAAAGIFDPVRTIATSVVPVNAQMEPAPGGFRVSGRWLFASGVPHSDWASGFIDGGMHESGRPIVWNVYFPPGSYETDGTWLASSSLRGTGSHGFQVEDLFVPEAHRADLFGPAVEPGGFRKQGFPEYLQMCHCGQALGAARGLIDEFIAHAARPRSGGGSPHNARPVVQVQVAEAEATLRAARAWAFEVLEANRLRGESGRPPTTEERAISTLCVGHVVQSTIRVAESIYAAAGSQAIGRGRIERCWRDIHAAGQHQSTNRQQYHNAGAVLLGLPHPML